MKIINIVLRNLVEKRQGDSWALEVRFGTEIWPALRCSRAAFSVTYNSVSDL